MKQLLTLVLFFSVSSLSALEQLLEIKASYFIPTNGQFKKVYGSGGLYGAEYSIQTREDLYAWTSFSYFGKSGYSIGLHDSSHLYMLPMAAGLKYIHQFHCFNMYVGMGAAGTYLNISDHSKYAHSKTVNWGFGGIAKTGIFAKFTQHFFLDLFAEYSFVWTGKPDYHSNPFVYPQRTNLSGWSFGGSIGAYFGSR